MSVKRILNDKGSTVYSVDEDSLLRDAIALLNSKNIGVVLITNKDGDLSGILSERDIIRRSLKRESGFRDEPVSKSMTRNVLTTTPKTRIDDVMEVMTNSRVRHIPVVEDGQILGLISIGDVVKLKIADTEQEVSALKDYISI